MHTTTLSPAIDTAEQTGAQPGIAGTALVADDDSTSRLTLCALLKQSGFRVLLAADGGEAVELFERERPDIVFMDILMPKIDGYEATRRIKSLATDGFVPVVFVTPVTDDTALARCIEAGGDDFLSEPYNQPLLRSKIKSMLRFREIHRNATALANRMQRDEEIAEQVFSGAVLAGNVALGHVKTLLRPAQLFSGDLLLTAFTPSGDINVLLGDFTGHGLVAALGAFPASETFRAMSAKGFSSHQILGAINQKLCDLLPMGMFLTTQFVRVSRDLTHVAVSNCGMPDFLIVDGASGRIRRRIESSNLALGITRSVDYQEGLEYLRIQPGDRIVLATDGISEARNPQGEMFGQARFEQVVEQRHSEGSSIAALARELDAFCAGAPQDDDISLAEIPCIPELFADAASAAHEEVEVASPSEHGEVAISIALAGTRLRHADPVPLLIGMLRETAGLSSQRSALFTILTELFVNALDHGVLGLDSTMKSTDEGFHRYYTERELRLAQLDSGRVALAVRVTPKAAGGEILVEVEDSGKGFDLTRLTRPTDPTSEKLCGRGIRLVRELCREVAFEPPGNRVRALFEWNS